MPRPQGWRPLQSPRGGVAQPFTALARAQAFIGMGDTLIALALANSLFFSISPDAARTRVALYLVLTMTPFALVAPLVGPWIDARQGGRRLMVVVAAAARAVICVLMIDDLDSLLLFPEAFAALVLGKAHGVARASLVPGLVRDDSELVEANSKLVLISGVGGFVAAVPGVVLLQLGAGWVLALAALLFTAGTVAALRIPPTRVAVEAPGPAERAELRGAGILLAASTMAVLRGIVGFLAFHLAFWLRGDGAPAWWFGVILAASAVGALAGAGVAPALRRTVREERMLLAGSAAVGVGALAVTRLDGRPSAAVLALVVGIAASAGRLAFDAIVQRDAPDANQGRSFARFETRFQLVWVVGAFVPVVITVPLGAGYLAVAVAAAIATVSYATGRQIQAAALARRVVRGTRGTLRR